MVSPTPVSSLLHSATMVCSGIYISYKYNINRPIEFFTLYLFLSLFIGLGLKDIKKIIAISTSNNINLMIINKNTYSYIHMLNHGLIKSLIFILSGFIIHNLYNQDIRKMKGYLYKEPILLKLFLLLFIPLPYIYIFNSKEYLYFSSSNFLIYYLYNYLYLSFSYYLYNYLYNIPTYSYYINQTKIYRYYLLIIPSLLFSLLIPLYYNSYNSSYFDLIYIFMYILPFFYINISLDKHYENIINKLIYLLI
jgi:NADH:ubiquinone oxidoreductase subunit 5 (subunit L)/multisubunit Na+/H+ antiporter MnhA subunit